MTSPEPQSAAKAKRGLRLGGPALVIAISIAAVLVTTLLLLRYGAVTPQGRMFVEARASGLNLGRIGRLRIEGVGGDIWRDFTVRRLTIADERGVWLDADDLHVSWRYAELFTRRFHANTIEAQRVRLLRRPTLKPKEKSGAAPISIDLDHFAIRLVMEPAFSGRAGDYDVSGAYETARQGGQRGNLDIGSRLHAGDFLKADFDLGRSDTLKLNAHAREAAGGALAGALGFDPRQPFLLDATASGTIKQGRFTIDAALAQTHPVKAQGQWSPQGGAAAGTVDLAASSLTAPYAARFGRQIQFQLNGAPSPGGLYALAGELGGDNIKLTARGLGDIGKKTIGPGGLALTAAIPDLSRVTRAPKMGPGQVEATLNGGGAHWLLDGTAAVQHFELAGYSLARVGGPARLTLDGNQLAIRAKLAGQGGQGAGALGVLLGPKPSLSAELVRFKDGRLLLRGIDGAGQGLKISGDGSRGLLGGLGFKGAVTVTNLTAIRPGAKGQLSARVNANQGATGKPWLFAIDGKGSNFATGLEQADRLLGDKPAMSIHATLDGASIAVADANLAGAMAKASGAGAIGPDKLALKIDWSANGPFQAGPLEIAGAAKGTGAVTGTPSAPALQLAADFDAIDAPAGLALRNAHLDMIFRQGAAGSDGEAKLTAASDYGPAHAATAFRFAAGGLDLTGLDATVGGVSAKGSLSLRSARPSQADLTLAVGPGLVLTSGRIAGTVHIQDDAGGPTAGLALTADNALLRGGAVSLTSARVSGSGPLADLPLTIQARGAARPGRWRVDLRGRLTAPAAGGYSLSLQGAGQLGRSRVATREAAVLRWRGDSKSARLRLTVGEGNADVDIEQGRDTVALSAVLSGADLAAIDEDLAGQVDARLSVNGRGSDLSGSLTANVKGARERGAALSQALDGDFDATLAGGTIKLSAAAATPQGLKAQAQLALPAAASASPLSLAIDRTKPMSGRFEASGEVKPLWNLLVGGQRSLSGHAEVAASLAGSLADPRVSGHGDLDHGAFEDGGSGLKLNNVVLRTVLSQTGVELQNASADDGVGGDLTAQGRFDLRRGAASTLRLDLRNFRLIDNTLGSASATGQAILSRNPDGRIALSGALNIDRADLTAAAPTPTGVVALQVIERNRPAELEPDLLQGPPPTGPGMAFDLTLKAPRRVFVKGRGLDVEMSLDAHLTGNSNAPLLDGAARIVRGDYDFAGKRFEFDNRGVVYLAANPALIRLDLTAVRDDPALTATVNIKGTAAKPEITLSSSPALPNDEVLSQVLFGSSAAQLSPLEAAQLASALAALSGGGGFDVIGNLRAFARLDRLSFAGDAAGGMTVAGGKYVTDTVYLEVIGGGREGPAAQVEWRVKRNLSLVSRLGATQDSRLSIRWRRDY